MSARPPTSPSLQRADWLLLALASVLSSVWCVTAARQLGATFDEPFYLQAGLDYWRTGNPTRLLAAGTMPLPSHLQTLPLYVLERVRGRPWTWPDELAAMLPIARSMTLLFWWVLLIYVMRLGRALGGPWAGRLAVLLLALEPSVLAHAALATTDLAAAACLLMFTVHFRAGRPLGWFRRVGLPTLLFAMALLAKASALTLGPLVMIGVEIERWLRGAAIGSSRGPSTWRVGDLWRASRALRRDGAVIVIFGVLLAVVYCGSGGGPSFQGTLSRMRPDALLRPVVAWVGQWPLMPNGFYALWFQADHNRFGQGTYLIGYESARWLWFYVPVLLTIKLSTVLLLLTGAALAAPGHRVALLVGLAATILLLCVQVRVQTGIRLLLPVLSFAVVGLAVRVAGLIESLPSRSKRVGIGLMTAMLAWLLVVDLRLWPDALRYVNAIWGGTERGYLVVSDSNYDWGQGLPDLARWRQSHQVPLAVWYFGTDPRYPELPRFDPDREALDEAIRSGRYLAVGTSWLYGGYVKSGPGREVVLRLRQMHAVARTPTFLIFGEAAP